MLGAGGAGGSEGIQAVSSGGPRAESQAEGREPRVSSKRMGMDGAGPAGMQVCALHSSSQHGCPCSPYPLQLLELVPLPPGWC